MPVRQRSMQLPQLFVAVDRSYVVHLVGSASDQSREWSKFMDLIAVVDGELGAVARDTDQAGAQSRAGQQGFVCLSADDRVQGCVLAEPLSHAYTSLDDNKCSRSVA
ncbi:hypothetical protein BC831DRAFT_493127 [Entophlyctis helioformis]|nr:hypothetical protein BC831DRAFT_493127 [Entophlyctis helioformis]